MLKNISKRIKGDRKYFAIVFFILFVILLSGIITPYIADYIRSSWKDVLSEKINGIEQSAAEIFNTKQQKLLNASARLKKELHKDLGLNTAVYGKLIETINGKEYEDFSVEVSAPNGKIIAWNGIIAVPQSEIFPLVRPPGETFFHNTEILSYLSVVDTVVIEHDQFYYIISLPVEKHYSLNNDYFNNISLTGELSDLHYTEFEIDYNPFTSRTKDGRKYSFEILNNERNKIGLITFIKPSLESAVNSLYDTVSKIQSILIVLSFLFLALGFRTEYRELNYKIVKLLFIALYLFLFRWLIFSVGFPSNLIESGLTDPSYFASAFGGGIVKSPVELLITIIFALIFSVKAFKFVNIYIDQKPQGSRNKLKGAAAAAAAALIFLPTLRGLAAAVKSIIFDSTLRYFKEPNLIPDEVSLLMNLNLLMLGVTVLLLLTVYLLIIFCGISWIDSRYKKLSFWTSFILMQGAGYIYIITQKEPLITPLMSFIFIAVVFLFAYLVYFENRASVYNYIYAAVSASIISITLLNYFNLDLERSSLKTTAFEINRPNDNLLKFLVSETVTGAAKNSEISAAFSEKLTNYDALAFKIWSRSALQREAMNSSVLLLDKSKEKLGQFNIGIENNFIEDIQNNLKTDTAGAYTYEIQTAQNRPNVFASVIPVMERKIIKGYIAAFISFDLESFGSGMMPEFLQSRKNFINSVIDPGEINILEFEDNKLVSVYGDIYPSLDQVKPILNAGFSVDQEAWININLNNEIYAAYLLRIQDNSNVKTTAVLLREKHFTWNLFNFFKIFIVHSLFILLLFLVLFTYRIKYFKYSFRTRLLISFLVLSIIPVIILAVYNRQVVEERSNSAVFNELSERVTYIENHVTSQLEKHKGRSINEAFQNAGKELGISFGVYSSANLIYNSKQQYYDIGLFPDKLRPEAHYQLNYLNYREFLNSEGIEDYNYNAFYKKVSFNEESYILGVNEAFNKVLISFSLIDVDVFLFGIYSFAIIIILVVSTILANNISAPIRKLTKATEAIGHGDLNVELTNKERGELRDLITGFNSMMRELQRNQADLAAMERESAWKEMAKQVAHEIKNPLTPMKLAVQQLAAAYNDKSKNFDAMFGKLTSTLLSQIESLNLIASEFSRFAKMPSIKFEVTDLIPAAEETINLFADEKVNISLTAAMERAEVEADPSQLRRMFINLIRNAIQAGADKIKIEMMKEEDNFLIIVADNGGGITEANRDKIFETNFTTKDKGMGIGLKLTKRFLEGINSTIALDSSSENGTSFKIIIPSYRKGEA